MEPIGIVRGRMCPQVVDIDGDCAVGELIESLNFPPKLNVIAVTYGRRMASNEKLQDGATVKLVSLALGG